VRIVGSDALSLRMPSGLKSLARANARVDWPVASATIADSRCELALL